MIGCIYSKIKFNSFGFPSKSINMKTSRTRFGPVAKKLLLLLEAGTILSLTSRPDVMFRVMKNTAREWKKINQRSLHAAIRRLYSSKLVDWKENNNGAAIILLTPEGKKKALRYHIDTIKIKTPGRWDALWRVVIFDIPEEHKKGRDALARKLKELGFYPIQKSVFVHPFECKNEIDFITEMFDLVPYVRFLRVKDIDISLELKRHFDLF